MKIEDIDELQEICEFADRCPEKNYGSDLECIGSLKEECPKYQEFIRNKNRIVLSKAGIPEEINRLGKIVYKF